MTHARTSKAKVVAEMPSVISVFVNSGIAIADNISQAIQLIDKHPVGVELRKQGS